MVGSISNVIWTFSSDYSVCQLNQLYSNSEAAMLSMNGIGKHLSLMIALKKFEESQEKRRKDKKGKKKERQKKEKRRKDNACRARAARKSQHKQISMMTAMKMLMMAMKINRFLETGNFGH